MDYIVTYEFPPGIEQKYKTNIGSMLKRRYEDKRLMNRLGKGKLLIDHEHIRDEIIEKLEKNKARIVEVKEFEEFPDSIKDFIANKKKTAIKPDDKHLKLLKKGFKELYNFFIWVRDNNKPLFKNPKMYVEQVKTLDDKLLNKIKKEILNE